MAFLVEDMQYIIEKYLPKFKIKSQKMKDDYELYKGNAKIFKRELPIKTDFTKHINHDFIGYIVDQSVGYLFGNPITYILDDDLFDNELVYEKFTKEFRSFRNRINTEDLDAETGKHMGVCGYGARLLYIDEDGKENAKNLMPYECEFFVGTDLEQKAAFRYFQEEIRVHGKDKTIDRVDFYDDTFITSFIIKGGKAIPYQRNGVFQKEHLFDYLNLIEYPNNSERLNDFDKVKMKINAYDEATSDLQSEIEQYRLALLLVYGIDMNDEERKKLIRTGIVSGIPNESKFEYLSKNVNDTFIQNQLKNLKTDIFLFANAVNFSDENFSGNASGVALEYKLLALENKCIQKERKFTAAQRTFLRNYLTSLKKRTFIAIEQELIDWKFNRNLPIDYEYQANILQKLKGFVSEDTRLSSSELVKDVETEKRKMKNDEEEAVGMNFDL